MTFDDISGVRYGRLVAKHRVGKKWLFVCDCGNEKLIWATNVKRGHTQSCGCYKNECVAARAKISSRTHGLTETSEHMAWSGIKQRCNNPKDKDFKNYGGRGIRVCDEWLNSFESFIRDMGMKPSKKHSLERDDVNGYYSPENCKWATPREQNRNKRNTLRVDAFGMSGCLSDFIIPNTNAYHRARKLIAKGWDGDIAIFAALEASL